MSYIINSDKILIETSITKIFPRLNKTDINRLIEATFEVLKYFFACSNFELIYNINARKYFINYLIKDDYDNLKSLIMQLLPYINTNTSSIVSLNDIILNKQTNVDINKEEPKYLYSNLQYSICKKENGRYSEVEFSDKILKDNTKICIQTLKMLSNKFHFNLKDIIPETDVNSPFCQNLIARTKGKLANINPDILADSSFAILENDEISDYYSGLYIGDIYNIIRNDIVGVIPCKWLLYYYLYDNTTTYTYLYILNILFELETRNENTWIYICQYNKYSELPPNISKLFDTGIIKLQNILKTKSDYKLFEPDGEEINVKYKTMRKIILELTKHIEISNDDIEDNDDSDNEEQDNYSYLQDIDLYKIRSEIYDYLYNGIDKLKHLSFYSQFVDNHNIFNDPNPNLYDGAKWTYNYCKWLVYEPNIKQLFPCEWNLLNFQQRRLFIRKLNGEIKSFGVGLTLDIYFNNIITSNQIYNYNSKRIIDTVVSCMAKKGILTRISLISGRTNVRVNNYFSLLQLEDLHELDWFERKTYTVFNQISLCSHYINNKVMFITGATGIGKSTEIPKLFVYYSICIHGLTSPLVYCTEPRTLPTVDNAKRVARLLRIEAPKKGDEESNKTNTNNYYIQYNSMTESHISPYKNYPTLRFITDGLFNEQLDALIEAQKQKIEKQQKTGKFISPIKPIIIVIDESHENSTNIILLITKCKQYLNENINLQVMLLSATIDNDEPIYRRYFKYISDKTKYDKDLLSKVNVETMDRRIHIGDKTLYTIEEEFNFNINNIDTFLKNNINNGLIFRPTQNEITKTIDFLKKKGLNKEILIIPFYALIKDKYNPSDIIKQIRYIDTENESEIIKRDNIVDKYSSVLIVASTIAEASITIDSLKFVIDDGKFNNVIYNYKYRKAYSEIQTISESRRLQRKGRVGRISAGIAMFEYPHSETLNVLTNYGIVSDDLTNEVFKLISLYKRNQIYDSNGTFYFIHPDEPNFKRNIGGDIINLINPDDFIIKNDIKISKKIISFYKKLEHLNLIDNKQTIFGKLIQNLQKAYFTINITCELQYILIAVYGYILDYFEESCQLTVLLTQLTTKINTVLSRLTPDTFDDSTSEIASLFKYINILNQCNYLIIDDVYYSYDKIKNKEINPDEIQYDYKIFNECCEMFNILPESVNSYHKNLINFKNAFLNEVELINHLNLLKSNMIIQDQLFDKLTAVLVLSNPFNICKHISDNYYMYIYYGDYNTTIKIDSFFDYVIYFDFNLQKNKGTITHPVSNINLYVDIFNNINSMFVNYTSQSRSQFILNQTTNEFPCNIVNLVDSQIPIIKQYFRKDVKKTVYSVIRDANKTYELTKK
jgi:hypothetical protein